MKSTEEVLQDLTQPSNVSVTPGTTRIYVRSTIKPSITPPAASKAP
ncbi:hypothetical protein ACFVS7_35530 [Streptomyces rubiginosohelvolus]